VVAVLAVTALGKRHLSTLVVTSDSSPMTLFTNRGHQTSSALTGAAGRFGTPTTPSGTPCRETHQPGPNGTLGGHTNPCTGAYRPAVN